MSEMNKEEILRLLNSREWFHAYEIAQGIFTPGKIKVNPKFALDFYGVPENLIGMSVLDIGAWDGPYSFELERRGANVVALDIQDPERTGFNIARKIKNSSVEYLKCSVYDLPDEFSEKFDLILFLGVYYHLKHPLLAFERIWQALNQQGMIYFEGAILDFAYNIDSFWAERRNLLKDLISIPVAYFTSGEFASDGSNWYVPTKVCLQEWLKATGFQDIRISEPLNKEYSRAGGCARKDTGYSHYEHGLV
jgi:SAM-dependent methyltransferase